MFNLATPGEQVNFGNLVKQQGIMQSVILILKSQSFDRLLLLLIIIQSCCKTPTQVVTSIYMKTIVLRLILSGMMHFCHVLKMFF